MNLIKDTVVFDNKWRCGGIARHYGLKIRREQSHEGWSPFAATIFNNK